MRHAEFVTDTWLPTVLDRVHADDLLQRSLRFPAVHRGCRSRRRPKRLHHRNPYSRPDSLLTCPYMTGRACGGLLESLAGHRIGIDVPPVSPARPRAVKGVAATGPTVYCRESRAPRSFALASSAPASGRTWGAPIPSPASPTAASAGLFRRLLASPLRPGDKKVIGGDGAVFTFTERERGPPCERHPT
jgi:hypothetical protein